MEKVAGSEADVTINKCQTISNLDDCNKWFEYFMLILNRLQVEKAINDIMEFNFSYSMFYSQSFLCYVPQFSTQTHTKKE